MTSSSPSRGSTPPTPRALLLPCEADRALAWPPPLPAAAAAAACLLLLPLLPLLLPLMPRILLFWGSTGRTMTGD